MVQGVKNLIETEIYNYMVSKLSYPVSIGKLQTGQEFDTPVINFFKVPSLATHFMPTYLDSMQFNARSRYYSDAQQASNDIINIFTGLNGLLGGYRVSVDSITLNGKIDESDELVNVVVTIGFKYSGL